jgi:hypothetical protein
MEDEMLIRILVVAGVDKNSKQEWRNSVVIDGGGRGLGKKD